MEGKGFRSFIVLTDRDGRGLYSLFSGLPLTLSAAKWRRGFAVPFYLAFLLCRDGPTAKDALSHGTHGATLTGLSGPTARCAQFGAACREKGQGEAPVDCVILLPPDSSACRRFPRPFGFRYVASYRPASGAPPIPQTNKTKQKKNHNNRGGGGGGGVGGGGGWGGLFWVKKPQKTTPPTNRPPPPNKPPTPTLRIQKGGVRRGVVLPRDSWATLIP